MKRPCLECRQVFTVEHKKQSRCTFCERGRAAPRTAEPWRMIYRVREWHRARTAVLIRDGHRCRALLDNGRRCGRRTDLQVHHDPPLEVLWGDGSDREAFIDAATDPRHLFTLCPECHARADAARRSPV